MLEKIEFEKWIKASHIMFEIFEGRFDAYPLTVRWISEWFNSRCFKVENDDRVRISALVKNFDYKVYGIGGALREKIDGQFKDLMANQMGVEKVINIGFAVSPYLFTWNFRRFKEYFEKKGDFNLEQYFSALGKFLQSDSGKLRKFREQNLIFSQIVKREVEEIFKEVNDELKKIGIGNNEPVGTAKLLHVFSPFYFPLIDNNIAKAVGLILPRGESLTCDSYLTWMESLKTWFQNYDMIERLETESQSSILKLVDEGLYVMSSINLRLRVERLGLRVG
jgi:hypothetical protein